MGISGLWDVLGDGEICHIADYAAAHFHEHKRPLRIAVDEACWRFRNLTPDQVNKIKEGEPAANPNEKTILWRILRLWRLNIQLLFVWDGMRKPGKSRRAGKGPGGGKVADDTVESLHRMFDALKVPYHRAPGEAEAECAKLQRLGIVDAVWSDDGDSFMFGCTTLIKQHKVKNVNRKDYIRIYKAATIQEKYDLDADSLVLFAVLSGGDYDLTGLRGCGPTTAKRVAKRKYGLARALAHCAKEDLPAWRHSLSVALQNALEVPSHFPNWKALEGYRNPAVSTEQQCENLRGLRAGWDARIDEEKLRNELRYYYNFTTQLYLRHVAPVFLVRLLARNVTPTRKQENLQYGIQLKRTRATKTANGEDAPAKAEVKIMYAAPLLVGIDIFPAPPEEDWSQLAEKDGTPYDPRKPIEGIVLSCFLQHGLPDGALEQAPPPRKRKSHNKSNASAGEASLDQTTLEGNRQHDSNAGPGSRKRRRATSDDADDLNNHSCPKKRGDTPKEAGPANKKSAQQEEVVVDPPPPSRVFQRLNLPELKMTHVVDLCESSNDEADAGKSSPGLSVSPAATPRFIQNSTAAKAGPTLPSARAIPKFKPLTPRKNRKNRPMNTGPSSSLPGSSSSLKQTTVSKPNPKSALKPATMSKPASTPPAEPVSRPGRVPQENIQVQSLESVATPSTVSLVPGNSIPRATLRELRAAAFAGRVQLTSAPAMSPTLRPPAAQEVIDLT